MYTHTKKKSRQPVSSCPPPSSQSILSGAWHANCSCTKAKVMSIKQQRESDSSGQTISSWWQLYCSLPLIILITTDHFAVEIPVVKPSFYFHSWQPDSSVWQLQTNVESLNLKEGIFWITGETLHCENRVEIFLQQSEAKQNDWFHSYIC